MSNDEGFLKLVTHDGEIFGLSYGFINGYHLASRKKGDVLFIHSAFGSFAAHGRHLALVQQKLDSRSLGTLRQFDNKHDTLPDTDSPIITHFSLPDDTDDE